MPKAWAVRIESVTRNPLLGQCTFKRTSLLSWVRENSYEGDWTPHQKAVKWNCQALKESHSTWNKISLLDIFYRSTVSFIIPLSLHPLSHTCTRYPHIHTCTLIADDEGWWLRQGQSQPLISSVTAATELLLILWEKGQALAFTHMNPYGKNTPIHIDPNKLHTHTCLSPKKETDL